MHLGYFHLSQYISQSLLSFLLFSPSLLSLLLGGGHVVGIKVFLKRKTGCLSMLQYNTYFYCNRFLSLDITYCVLMVDLIKRLNLWNRSNNFEENVSFVFSCHFDPSYIDLFGIKTYPRDRRKTWQGASTYFHHGPWC